MADLVIVSQAVKRPSVTIHPLFRYEVFALLANQHPLTRKKHLLAPDFAAETLITYPIPDDRLDLVREVLIPANIHPTRRKTELTVAILQLVASHRGVADLPAWTVQPFLDRGYVTARPIGKRGLFANLHAATTPATAKSPYVADFIQTMKRISFET